LIRGYTGHEHLEEFGLINMNARLYDPILGRMLSPDNYVHGATQTQGYNRYSYVLNNPLKYTDPDGNEPISAAIILVGMVAGGYTGYKIADSKGYNFSNWQMYAYIYGGMAVGAFSAGAGAATAAGGGIAANTMGIVAGSSFSSTGFSMLSGMQTPVTTSVGVASYDWTNNEWGYLGKPGNSKLQNVGYGLGALANVQDLFAGTNGTDINVGSHNSFNKETPHSYISGDNIDISVANSRSTGAPNFLKYAWRILTKPKKYSDASHYDVIDKSKDWTVTLNNVRAKGLQNITKNIKSEPPKGLFGWGKLRFGVGFGCVQHSSRSLLANGVWYLPFNLMPEMLNAQLLIRQYGIYFSPYLLSH
jgi:RHS repeat-associated protein